MLNYGIECIQELNTNHFYSTEELISIAILICLVIAGIGDFALLGVEIRTILAMSVVITVAYAAGSSIVTDIYDIKVNKNRNKTGKDILINAIMSAAVTLVIPMTYFSAAGYKPETKSMELFFNAFTTVKGTLIGYGTSSIRTEYAKKKNMPRRNSGKSITNNSARKANLADRKMRDLSLFIG